MVHFFKKDLFVYLFHFLTMVGLRCCMRACSGCSQQGLLSMLVLGLLTAVAALVGAQAVGSWASVAAASGLQALGCGLSSRLFHGMWDLPEPGVKLVSLALQGGFLATRPAGKSQTWFLMLPLPLVPMKTGSLCQTPPPSIKLRLITAVLLSCYED